VLNRKKASEGNSCVEIRPAGFLELRSDFGHARGDDRNDRKGQEEPNRTKAAETSRDQRRQAKNARAHHGVDHERGQAPAADGSNESGLGLRQVRFRLSLIKRLFGANVRLRESSTRFRVGQDRKSTRLNSSHVASSYAVFCLKKKNITSDASVT